MNNRKEGVIGELDAVKYLKSLGYKILETNAKNNLAEIDIIAEDKGTLVFCEVKSRSGVEYGRPMEAVTRSKQLRYIRFATKYVAAKRLADRDIRFDVIEVLQGEINHVISAYEA